MKTRILCGMLLVAAGQIAAQDLPLPLNFRKAFENNTRTISGNPGKKYWQNHAQYAIRVTVQPLTNQLDGSETVRYYNESPDTITRLVLRLYQDLFKTDSPRQFRVSTSDLHGGILLDSVRVNGEQIDLLHDRKVVRTPTNLILPLKKPLLPKTSVTLSLNWSFPIPHAIPVRMGHYPNGSLFMAYFYPQVAVYDDTDGWDTGEYAGIVEFYNDFSDYDLTIKAPGEYIIWGTGELVNKEEIFKNHIISKLDIANSSDSTVRILSPSDPPSAFFRKTVPERTWKFVAHHVPDVSFALAQGYVWDATSVTADTTSHRRVLVSAVYPPGAPGYDRVAEISARSVSYMSFEMPGIPYPYPFITTFCNGKPDGGMEFPMMTNNGAPVDFPRLAGLTFHEIAHTYFPFYMGTNERKHAWMDEGWATLWPEEIVDVYDSLFDYRGDMINKYLQLAGTEYDIPLCIPSAVVIAPAYRSASYYRSALAYHFLEDALGKAAYRSALGTYINRWKEKHPLPQDFFNTMAESTRKNLDWYWKPWFYELAYADLQLVSAVPLDNEIHVTVRNSGGLPLPVSLRIINTDGKQANFYWSCSLWETNPGEITLKIPDEGDHAVILLGNRHIPDIRPEDNVIVLK